MKETKNQWFAARSEMYATLASDAILPKSKVKYHFHDPEAGWVKLDILFDDKIVETLSLSNVWDTDPVRDIMHWLERTSKAILEPTCLYIDGEGDDYLLQFDPLAFPTHEQRKNFPDHEELGVFSVLNYDYNADIRLHYCVCNKKIFISTIYNAICDFAERQSKNPPAGLNWADQLYPTNHAVPNASTKDSPNSVRKMVHALQSTELDAYTGRLRKKNK